MVSAESTSFFSACLLPGPFWRWNSDLVTRSHMHQQPQPPFSPNKRSKSGQRWGVRGWISSCKGCGVGDMLSGRYFSGESILNCYAYRNAPQGVAQRGITTGKQTRTASIEPETAKQGESVHSCGRQWLDENRELGNPFLR